MPSASCYTNRVRIAAQSRNVKVMYPGNIGNLTQSLLAISCNVPVSRWDSLEYKQPCNLLCKPQTICNTVEQRYDSGDASGVSAPCSIMDGLGIYVNTPAGTTVLDAGVEC